MSGRARTSTEMHFAASLQPCPACGSRETGELELRGQGTGWALSGTCPSCGKPRGFAFESIAGPHDVRPPIYELGPGPSELISAAEFEAEVARQLPHVDAEPERLAPEPWERSRQALRRALIALNEWLKLTPAAPAAKVEERDRLRALAQRYTDDGDRVYRLEHPHPPKGKLDPESLRAHMRWLQAGQKGGGRLELEYLDLSKVVVGTQQLSWAKLTGVKLIDANLRYATLDDTLLRNLDASGANFDTASLRGAFIDHGTYVRARFTLTNLDGIKIDGADMTGADFERAIWKGARIVDAKLAGVRFGNSRIDEAEFSRCDLRGASFARLDRLPEPTTRGTRFEDCDLRETDWTGRDLRDTAFVRCQFAGAKGKPDAIEGLVVEGGNVTRDALLRQLG